MAYGHGRGNCYWILAEDAKSEYSTIWIDETHWLSEKDIADCMDFRIVHFKQANERELPMSHVLFAGYCYLEPGAKETDLYPVITVLFLHCLTDWFQT